MGAASIAARLPRDRRDSDALRGSRASGPRAGREVCGNRLHSTAKKWCRLRGLNPRPPDYKSECRIEKER